jgi:hypothetical protein
MWELVVYVQRKFIEIFLFNFINLGIRNVTEKYTRGKIIKKPMFLFIYIWFYDPMSGSDYLALKIWGFF